MTGPCDPAPVAPGAFALAGDGSHWTFSGGLTFETAADVLAASAALPWPKSGRVDMSGLAGADSAALAVLLALKRRASAERHRLHIEGLPETLTALSNVYGVHELIAG